MKKKLHTPEGVRDIYNVECGKKLALESRLKKVFHLYGYHDIQTPTIEYFDVFREEIGTTPILPRLLQEHRQLYLKMKIFRSVCVIQAIHL